LSDSAKFQSTWSVARPLCDSSASYLVLVAVVTKVLTSQRGNRHNSPSRRRK